MYERVLAENAVRAEVGSPYLASRKRCICNDVVL